MEIGFFTCVVGNKRGITPTQARFSSAPSRFPLTATLANPFAEDKTTAYRRIALVRRMLEDSLSLSQGQYKTYAINDLDEWYGVPLQHNRQKDLESLVNQGVLECKAQDTDSATRRFYSPLPILEWPEKHQQFYTIWLPILHAH